MKFQVDRKLPISIHQQLRGAIAHEISFGTLKVGAPLPSVRELAEQTGVAPMTISKIYADLKASGLIEGRSGSGTFVADSPLAKAATTPNAERLRHEIDGVIDHALALGVGPDDIAAMVHARVPARLGARRTRRIAMIGLFDDATASYAERVTTQVGKLAMVECATLDMIRNDPEALARVQTADLVLTFANLEEDIEAQTGRDDVISLRFIPSEATRMALASIDPMARVAVVSRFEEFLPILTLGIRRFAAHVQRFTALNMDAPELEGVLADSDVLVFATGADDVTRQIRPGALTIEYRHIPDPGDIDRLVMPLLTETGNVNDKNRKEAS